MSELPKFPPDPRPIPFSERRQIFKTCSFYPLRKIATEGLKREDGVVIYVLADNRPLSTYQESIADRELIRNKILEYELAQGFLIDDRTTPVDAQPVQIVQPQQQVMPMPMPIMPTIQTPQTQVQPVQAPAPVQQAVPQMVPQPQPPPTSSTEVIGKKRPGPRGISAPLASAVAPPPPPPGAVSIQVNVPNMNTTTTTMPMTQPAPVIVPPTPAQEVAQPQSFQPMAFIPPPIPVQPQPTPMVTQVDPSLSQKIDIIGKGLSEISSVVEKHSNNFTQFAQNLTEEVKSEARSRIEIEKSLKEIQRMMDLMMSAIHHMYLSTAGLQQQAATSGVKIQTSSEFVEYMKKFTTPRP